jgi:LPS-assembly protein
VQDRGKPSNGESYSGASLYVLATSDLHKGWTARAQVNYISSFRFRKEFTESYSEAVTSEVHSVGFVNKNWPWITLDVAASLLKNYQDEIKITDAETGEVSYLSNAITIRKIPEAQWSGRDRKLFRRLPLWYSFDASAGLLYRDEPLYSGSTLVNRLRTQAFMPRLHIAPHVTTAFHWHGIHLIPSFGIYETYYGQARVPHSDYFQVSGTDMVSSAREFTADLVLPSLARVYRRKTVFGDALKHVIEPRATYRYVTGVGEDFARFVRFDETEMLANTNEVELSLANRIYSKRGDSIQEIFSWQLWQKRYFDTTFGNALIPGQRNTFLSGLQITPYAFLAGGRSTSPVASVLRANPGLGFGTEWRADYDPRVRQVVNSSLNVDYRHDQFFASAAHNLVDTSAILGTKADQFRFTTGVGSSTRRGWNAGGTLIYNYHKRAAENANFQVTYNTDCCGVSFEYQRNFVNNTSPGVRFAFTVANFGSVGNLRQQDRMF